MDEIEQIRADVQMVDEAVRGSPAGAERLAERLKCIPRILAAYNHRLGGPLDTHDIADLTQDTTVVILGKLGDYEGRSSIEGWIYRICSFEIMNAVRRKRRLPRPTEDALERKDRAVDVTDIPAGTERFDDVHSALGKIQRNEADVIRLKHFEDLTFDEIGSLEGLPSSTVKARYYRGIASLERMLGPDRE
jgi:RNA polymerase sigma-70 factor (ECF subfamily)